MLLECFFATKTLMRERITENTRVQFPVGTKVWRGHLVYVASGITSRRTKQRSGKKRATSLPTGNWAPSGAVIFSPRVFLCYKNTYARVSRYNLESRSMEFRKLHEDGARARGRVVEVPRLLASSVPSLALPLLFFASSCPLSLSLSGRLGQPRLIKVAAPSEVSRPSLPCDISDISLPIVPSLLFPLHCGETVYHCAVCCVECPVFLVSCSSKRAPFSCSLRYLSDRQQVALFDLLSPSPQY